MSQINNSTSGSKKNVATLALAAATALAGSAGLSLAAPVAAIPGVTPGVNNVTAIGVTVAQGTATTVLNVPGAGQSYSPFVPANKYTVNYLGTLEAVSSITAGGVTSVRDALATNVIRRFVGPNNDMLWYTGTNSGTTNGSVITLDSIALGGFNQAFDQNSVNVGADNLFSTQATAGNPVGNNTNVDRVDLLFAGGVTVASNKSFAISDRGDSATHDSFALAAITSLDANGNPASYGPLLKFTDGTWGTTNVTPTQEEIILRKNDNLPNDTLHPSDYTDQGVGAVDVTTAAMVGGTGATTIYGYSLFSPQLNVTGDGSGTQLVNWTNSSVYLPADSTATGGGLDPAAFIAQLYTSTAVPEPTTAALATSGAASLLLSRRRKGASRRGA